ncbi:hypothetical protein Tco_0271769 [Tanacetum coccineum]
MALIPIVVHRIRHEEEIDVLEYQVLTREIEPTLKPLEEIIRENVFCLGGNRDHVPACLCFMLYCVVHSEKFNLAYYMAKRMEWVTKQARLLLPYGMLLTRLFTFIMNENPELNNESYVLYDHVMTPLAAQLERKPRRDRGMRRGRHSTSSSSAFDQPSSSHLNDDDDYGNDEGTSRASTPSPIRYVNSLTDQVPQVFQNPPDIDPHLEPFYTRQTEIINRQVQLRDEQRGGVRSIGKSLRRLWRNMKKELVDIVKSRVEYSGSGVGTKSISESECDLPVCDDSSPEKDEVLDDIISIPPGNGNDHFNVESSLIESMLNRDYVISSPKIDFLLEEFAGELALIAPIPPRIVEAEFGPKGDIHFIENLMYDNSFPRPSETLKDDSETIVDSNNDYSSSDDDSPYSEDIDYIDALPLDPELVSLEVVGNVVQEDGEIDIDILLTIKDDILHEKLLKVNLLIAKIEALKDNPTPSSDFVTKSSSTSLNFFLEETNTFDNSLPESETFCFNLEEISSGSPTSYLDLSLPDYEAFFYDREPMDVVEDIFENPTREPRVHVPNVLPTHPTLQLDSEFTLSSDSLGSDFVVSFPSGTRNKIFDPGILIEVQSKRFLSPNEFYISFIRYPLSLVFDTLLIFSSESKDNVFNPGILASNEEKSPHLLSHRGFKAFQLISESPMMISGGDIPILDVLFLHFYPPWPAQV